jgi:hypothetical protein
VPHRFLRCEHLGVRASLDRQIRQTANDGKTVRMTNRELLLSFRGGRSGRTADNTGLSDALAGASGF